MAGIAKFCPEIMKKKTHYTFKWNMIQYTNKEKYTYFLDNCNK
jgi:hypothetical protein